MDTKAVVITAKYKGKCSVCQGNIEPGTPIFWEKATKTIYHEECPEKALFEDGPDNDEDFPQMDRHT